MAGVAGAAVAAAAVASNCASPSEEAIGIIPLDRPCELQAVEPAAEGRGTDRFETHIGDPEFAGCLRTKSGIWRPWPLFV